MKERCQLKAVTTDYNLGKPQAKPQAKPRLLFSLHVITVKTAGFECHLHTTWEGYVSGFAVLHDNMLPKHLFLQLFEA